MFAPLRDPITWAIALLTLAAKAPLLWLNQAEYTDGLIQLGLFENGCPLYMPLYTLCVQPLMVLGLDPVMAGRVVSLLAHGATLFPLAGIAVWLTGERSAGRWTAALCAVSPVPTRWALRVMTDSLFSLWWWTAIALLLAAAPRLDRSEHEGPICPFRATALFLFAGALAALTRHTGWILFPLGLLALFALMRQDLRHALRPTLALFAWALPLGWMLVAGAVEGHGAQVGARFSLLSSAILLEAYALDWPLIVGWPLAILTVWGLARPVASGPRWRWFLLVAAWCTLGILAMQCLIQSYLFRYLLPLVGFACVIGGCVMARLRREHPRALAPVAALVLGGLLVANASSLWRQRTAWGDFRLGAEAMGAAASPDTPCFTNETYAMWPEGDTTKAEWWSGREVGTLITAADQGLRLADLPPGSLVLISTAYGGHQAAGNLFREIGAAHEIATLGRWESALTPLLPDIMDGRYQPALGLHQNPLALRFRHVEQRFETILIRVIGPRRLGG